MAKARREPTGIEIGLVNGWGVQQVVVPTAVNWLITSEGLLAVKDEADEEIVHFADGRWAYVGHLGLVDIR